MSTSKARFQQTTGKSTRSVSKAGVSGSGSKRINAVAASGVPGAVKTTSNIQVILNGKIVTPQSLLPRKASSNQATKKYRRPSGQLRAPVEDTIAELPENPKSLSKIPFGRSLSGKDLAATDRFANRRATRSEMHAEKPVDEKVVVTLSETSTETLLFLPCLVISNETREVVAIEERNQRYESLVDSHKNSDGFSNRPTQTLNNFQKNQNDMAIPNAASDFGCQVISYEISDALAGTETVTETDAFASTSATDDAADQRTAGLTPSVQKFVRDTVGVAVATPGCLLNVDDLSRPADPQEMRKDGGRAGGAGGRPQRGGMGGPITASRANTTVSHTQTDENSGSRPSNSGLNVTNYAGDDSEGEISERQNFSQTGEPQGQVLGGGAPAPDGQQLLREREAAAIMESKSLLRKLQLAERTVLQNIYHRQHLDYRDLPDVKPLVLTSKHTAEVVDSTDQLFGGLGIGGMTMSLGGGMGGMGLGTTGGVLGKTSTPINKKSEGTDTDDVDTSGENAEASSSTLPKLFAYRAESVVRGRPVTAMAWNAANADLLAVGYGRVDFSLDGGQKPVRGMAVDEELCGGLVLFWSLRNPQHPEKVLRTAHPVTALDFSRRSPTLLALGLYNGDVDVYDVRRENDWGRPVQSSSGMEGGHTDPVWQVRWVMKGQERQEILVSISTDGRVLEWNLKKGLVVTTLMVLKRGGVGEGWISRQAAGLGFDFVPEDSSTYVVGTEEGQVHRCSVSYNEQYLDTYEPHNGPVYRVKFSTRWPDVFLSCSADWTMGLYHIRSSSSRGPLLKLHCTGQEFGVSDISWCPGNSTVFAAVTRDARLQIWDLSVSAIDPVINFDTNVDAEPETPSNGQVGRDGKSLTPNLNSKPGSPDLPLGGTTMTGMRRSGTSQTVGQSRRDDRDKDDIDKDKETPVARLLRSLGQTGNRRSLTSVLFGERSPIVVVGDNRGAVTVYRVTRPVLFTHEGPVQQRNKLRDAVLRQSDPLDAAKLQASGSSDALSNGVPEHK
eukprot:CAMPEP_0182422554 /NCGR_PEP_ID=MMETSP1167-20130531/8285_1 /TAXON_ID=2988 /ORGANISM="Mallomonas Sp, Strain CCMP3275" /LENGTH=1009 /DNA_ID=CAMNT_0024600719 /DNA_START=93 /DNA_END=3122 /DNA_ORIENTATION=-